VNNGNPAFAGGGSPSATALLLENKEAGSRRERIACGDRIAMRNKEPGFRRVLCCSLLLRSGER
jgi:hypothetical protein